MPARCTLRFKLSLLPVATRELRLRATRSLFLLPIESLLFLFLPSSITPTMSIIKIKTVLTPHMTSSTSPSSSSSCSSMMRMMMMVE